ncbi:MAG: hypothetical protein WAM60_02380 [Candidatus Promineifilaceae bacterium]
MANEQTVTTRNRPGFFGRFLRALVKVFLVLVVVAALGIGGYLGIRELSQSLLTLSADSYTTAARVDLLRSDVNSLMENETDGRRQSSEFQSDLTTLDGRVSAVEREMGSDLTQQEAQLSALEERLDAMIAAGTVISENVATLNAGVGALQTDIVSNSSDIDSLGGEVDGLQSELLGLTDQTDTLEASLADPLAATEDVTELRQILVLFRVWELVARARLRLVEDNPGQALADVQSAQTVLGVVIDGSSEEMAAALDPVQERLDLAATELPDDPVTASRDLETGWEALDSLLGELIGVPVVSAEEGAGTAEVQQ